MSPFIMQSFKKIVGADFEKIDKVDFRDIQTYRHTDRHTDIQTYRGYLIGPSPSGGPKVGEQYTQDPPTWEGRHSSQLFFFDLSYPIVRISHSSY